MKLRDIITALRKDGWVEVRQTGSHKQFKHSAKHGTVTVPYHGDNAEIKGALLASISRQSGVKLK